MKCLYIPESAVETLKNSFSADKKIPELSSIMLIVYSFTDLQWIRMLDLQTAFVILHLKILKMLCTICCCHTLYSLALCCVVYAINAEDFLLSKVICSVFLEYFKLLFLQKGYRFKLSRNTKLSHVLKLIDMENLLAFKILQWVHLCNRRKVLKHGRLLSIPKDAYSKCSLL